MRLAFFGTPEVAVGPLRVLAAADDVELLAVVTNPDRARGRSQTLVAPPVKLAATELGIPVWQPERPREIVDDLAGLRVDAVAVVAYGAILPTDLLNAGGRGFVNLHYSLLPRWRGAAPVQHAVRAGDVETGVTTFVLDAGMDTGPVLRAVRVPIGPEDTSGDVFERLNVLGGPLLLDAVRALVAGEDGTPQSDAGATLAPKISVSDVELDLTQPAAIVDRLIRSANPAPGAHTTFRGRRCKVWRSRLATEDEAEASRPVAPGAVVATVEDGIVVACGSGGAIVLTQLQPDGKPRMTGAAFGHGYQPEAFGGSA